VQLCRDGREDLRDESFELGDLVAERPQVHPYAAASGVRREQPCAVLGRTDAHTVSQLRGLAPDQRGQDVAQERATRRSPAGEPQLASQNGTAPGGATTPALGLAIINLSR
jgi:hypothetical protein